MMKLSKHLHSCLLDGYRIEYYKRLKEFFAKNKIDFKSLETGEVVEL